MRDNITTFILNHEGGYVFDKDDPGGETKYGISKRSHPKLDIKTLTKKQAQQIYQADYIEPIIDQIINKVGFTNLQDKEVLLLMLVDASVQHGKSRMIKFLQKALNSLNITEFPALTVDGACGHKTTNRLDVILSLDLFSELCAMYIHHRLKFYTKLSTKKRNKKYLLGWVRRVNDLIAEAVSYKLGD